MKKERKATELSFWQANAKHRIGVTIKSLKFKLLFILETYLQ